MSILFTSGKFQALDSSGNPLASGKVYTYAAGTTTPLASYTTRDMSVANANPVILDAAGRADIWLSSAAYRVIVKTSADVTVYDTDNIATDAGGVLFDPGTLYPDGTVGAVLQDMHGARAFNLYVSVTGDDSNDGLTAGTPFATLQKAFDTLMAIGVVGGTRIINIAAGTYNTVSNRRAVLGPANEVEGGDPNTDPYKEDGIVCVNYIVVQGPDVGYDPISNPWPTPTAIFDGGGSSSGCLVVEGRLAKVLFKNIKVQNYAANGLTNDSAAIRTENMHFSGCLVGIDSLKGSIEVRGGDFYGTAGKVGTGVRSLFKSYHSIGDQSAVGSMRGPRMRYLAVGLHAQEGATGHADSVLFEDCVTGLYCTVNSRFNYAYSNFKRCTRAVRCEYNSVVFHNSTAEFNAATADANDEIFMITTGGVSLDTTTNQLTPKTFVTPEYGDMPMTITGTTSVVSVLEVELPAGHFAPQTIYSTRKPIQFRLHAYGNIPAATADVKLFSFRLGTTMIVGSTLTYDVYGDWIFEATITLLDYNKQAGSSKLHARFASDTADPLDSGLYTWVDVDTGTEDTKASTTTLKFTIQPQNAADTITVNYAQIDLVG